MSLDILSILHDGVQRTYDRDIGVVGLVLFVVSVINSILMSNLASTLSIEQQGLVAPNITASFNLPVLNTPSGAAIPVVAGILVQISVLVILVRAIDAGGGRMQDHRHDLLRSTAHLVVGSVGLLAGMIALFIPLFVLIILLASLLSLGNTAAMAIGQLVLAVIAVGVSSLTLFFVPEVALNDSGFIQAIKDSIELTRDDIGRVIGIVLATAAIVFVVGQLGRLTNGVLGLIGVMGFLLMNAFSVAGLVVQWGILMETYDRLG